MTLIQSNEATEKLGASARNFNLLTAKQPSDREGVLTQVALDCFEDMEKAQLGWGYKIKKFFATTFSYSSVLAAPFIVLITAIWFNYAKIFNLDIATLAVSGSVIGGMVAADLTLGKLFGIRPITACLIASYDIYRQGAKTISRMAEKSYNDHEEAMKKLADESRKVLIEELQNTYLGIAKELPDRRPDEIAVLREEMPKIIEVFSGLGLKRSEISKILSPIAETMKMLPQGPGPKPLPQSQAGPKPLSPLLPAPAA